MISGSGLAEPSPPYSLEMYFTKYGIYPGSIASIDLDLSSASEATLSYQYQLQLSRGLTPGPTDDLIVDYWDSTNWIELERQLASGVDMTNYVESSIGLPPEASDLLPASRTFTTRRPSAPSLRGVTSLVMQSVKCWHSAFSGSPAATFGIRMSPVRRVIASS